MKNSNTLFVLVVSIVSLVILFGGVALLSANSSSALTDSEKQNILNSNNNNTKGDSSVKVTLIEFSDFQCPACGAFYKSMQDIETKFGNSIKIVYRHYPLTTLHANAYKGALASEAAAAQGKFWEMYDQLFQNQDKWVSLSGNDLLNKFVEYAQVAGIPDINTFKDDVSSSKYSSKIDKDISDFNKLGVPLATPTVFLNGTKVDDLSLSTLESKITDLLK